MRALFCLILASILTVGYGRPNFNDQKVLENIIEQAVKLEAIKKADGTTQHYEPLELSPYKGSGWGVVYHKNQKVSSLLQFKGGFVSGFATTWYENGQKQAEMNFKDGQPDGLILEWYENGQKKAETNFKDGKIIGLGTNWYDSGQMMLEMNYKDGKEDGLTTQWYESGKKKGENSGVRYSNRKSASYDK